MVQSNYDRVILADAICSARPTISTILQVSESDILFDFEFDNNEKLEIIMVSCKTEPDKIFTYRLINGYVETTYWSQFMGAKLSHLQTYVQIANTIQRAATFSGAIGRKD